MPITSPGNDDDTGENHQPTLRKNTAEPVEQTLKQNNAVLKNPGDLTDRQSEAFGNLRNTGPKGQLYRSWQLKELLRTLLKHPLEQARGELRHWVFRASHSRIPEIVEPAKKIRRRRPDILRTIQLGYSNARLEAFNNRIKVTIRMAYGFHRVTNLIALIMLRCGGLDIRLPQPTI